MYYINLRNNYAINSLVSLLIAVLYFKHFDYFFFGFILLSIAYILILLPFFILQAITKWPISLAYILSFFTSYIVFIFLFKGDNDFITELIKWHESPNFWCNNFPFLAINIISFFLLKIKEDSKKINDLSPNK
jgi:hypothetical protein